MGADQEEARILIAAIVERIEAARDERVIDGSHRDQPRTEMGGCKPKRGEHQEEVVLGNAKLDMLSRLMRCPFLRRRDFRLLEHVRKLLSAEEPTRSEEHTSELKSLMRKSYAVLCLKNN